MKWIGQHIWDFVSRFRSDVYFENLQGSAETTALVVDADGKVTTNSLSGGSGDSEASKVRLPVRFKEAVLKGDPVYISGYNSGQDRAEVQKADCNDANKMPSFGLADADYSLNDNGYVISIGNLEDVDTQAYSVGDTLYVASGGGLTNIKPATELKLIQNVGVVTRSQQNSGMIEVVATGRSNDVPNLDENAIFLGDSNDKSVQTDAPMIGLVTAADSAAARTVLNVDVSGTDNSTNVTLAGTPDYITISGQEITRNAIDLTADVTGFLPVANGGTGANNVTGARVSLGVDAAGTDNSTNVTLAGEDYLSLSGQEITASDIDLTDNVTGILPIANGGTGSSTQKVIQVFPMNFLDDLGTTKHYMPFVTNIEQTVNYQEEAAMVMPADGRVVSVTVHMAQMHNNDGNITIGIETSACGQSYANAWTIEETEVIAATQADDHHVFHFGFDNAKHFDSTDKLAISIQQSADMQSANRFFWVSTVIEYDWSTFLGGTSAEYTTTP